MVLVDSINLILIELGSCWLRLVDLGLKFAIGISSLSALGCAKLGKILITSDAQRRIVSYQEKKRN